MTKKIVLKILIHDNIEKQKAMKAVSSFSGLESLAIDMKEKKLTVVGDVDPVEIVSKLRKSWHTEILTVGPAKEPEKKKEDEKKEEKKGDKKEDEKKKEEKKEDEEKEENKDDNKKEDEKNKEDENKKKESEQIAELLNMYKNYNYTIQQAHAQYYHVDEKPHFCVIC